MPLDAQAITRIIDAVEASAGREFPWIDRTELQKELADAKTYFAEMKVERDKSPKRKRVEKNLAQISKLAQKVDKDLADKSYEYCTAGSFNRVGAKSPEELRRALHPATKLYYKPNVADPRRLLGLPGSPFVRIAGRYLREVFEKHFKIKAGYTVDPVNDEVRNPYIDFAEQVLIELKILNNGKPYTRKSIADAVTDTRKQEDKRQDLAAE